MKNKDVEDIVFKALDFFDRERDSEVDKITKEAFAAHRVQRITELQIKNLERFLEDKDKEIWQHKKAIENLRGYMSFLESQIEQYKFRLDEHEDSY
jgi:DNA gyrase/topoisomerase IV subunit A